MDFQGTFVHFPASRTQEIVVPMWPKPKAQQLGSCSVFVGSTCYHPKVFWLVVSIILYFHPYLGKWSNFTNIFQMGCNRKPLIFLGSMLKLGECMSFTSCTLCVQHLSSESESGADFYVLSLEHLFYGQSTYSEVLFMLHPSDRGYAMTCLTCSITVHKFSHCLDYLLIPTMMFGHPWCFTT